MDWIGLDLVKIFGELYGFDLIGWEIVIPFFLISDCRSTVDAVSYK